MKMPTFEELKKLPTNEEYYWKVFKICGNGYIRFSYNEDFLGKISVDYINEYGYITFLNFDIDTNMEENELYELNEENYNNLRAFIELIRKTIVENVINENVEEE